LAKRRIPFTLLIDEHLHKSVIRGPLQAMLYYAFRILFAPTLRRHVDCFAAISEETSQIMHQYLGIPSKSIFVVPLGADTTTFRFDPEGRDTVRRTLGIPPDALVCIYAGKLIPDKGPHLLIEAFIAIAHEFPMIRLLLVGSGQESYMQSMQLKLAQANLTPRVHWTSFQPNQLLYRYYSAADFAVFPLQETISIVEASASGLPVIAKDTAVIRERLATDSGLVYTEGNVVDLARQMRTILNMPTELRRAMGTRGRQLVDRRFSWRAISEQFMRLYTR
jgi:1,4-alpha-glucan branching enzyme